MSGIRTVWVESVHAYTRSRVPWRLETNESAQGRTSKGKVFGWKLFHYLAGGGMKIFGRSVEQEEKSARQSRFLSACGVLALAWLALLIF